MANPISEKGFVILRVSECHDRANADFSLPATRFNLITRAASSSFKAPSGHCCAGQSGCRGRPLLKLQRERLHTEFARSSVRHVRGSCSQSWRATL